MRFFSRPGSHGKRLPIKCCFMFLRLLQHWRFPWLGCFIPWLEIPERTGMRCIKSRLRRPELWAIIVFAVFVLAAVYLSVAGVVLSRRVRGQFVRWVKKGGKLYFVSASASNVRASGSSRRISSSLKLQDASLNVLNDSGALEDILNGKTAYAFIQAIPVTSVTWVRQRKRGTKVYFQNKKVFLSKKM